uniref:DNA-3-methyladenine glycosylase II n=1 Tax=Chrysemys picta bellii TaxID=8478 RepID=A0A8C3PF04_CHRPI
MGRGCLPEGSAGAGPEAPDAAFDGECRGRSGRGNGRAESRSGAGLCSPSGEAGLPRLSPSSASPLLTAPAGGGRAQILVHKLPDGRELRGKIVETEAYLGGEDAASHSKGGKQTARNTAMFMKPGTLYVYQIYGIYFCMNVSSQAEAHLGAKQLLRCMTRKTGSRSVENQKKQYRQFFGEGAAVLLRSLEPLQGLDTMRQLRSTQRKGSAKPLKDWQLCNGPSKLCQALAINKSFDQKDLARDTAIWMEPGSEAPGEQAVVTAARIGVSYGGEWAQKPLRFYIRGNKCVSVVDKKVEREQGAAD